MKDCNCIFCKIANGEIPSTTLYEDEDFRVIQMCIRDSTLTMELGNGYEAIYGQLADLTVEEGDTIEAGTLIGYVGEPTKYYTLEGSNLYFQLLKDDDPVNPMDVLE